MQRVLTACPDQKVPVDGGVVNVERERSKSVSLHHNNLSRLNKILNQHLNLSLNLHPKLTRTILAVRCTTKIALQSEQQAKLRSTKASRATRISRTATTMALPANRHLS